MGVTVIACIFNPWGPVALNTGFGRETATPLVSDCSDPQKGRPMEWQKPEFIEIDMNAEIGAYQRDTGDGTDPDRIAPTEAELETATEPSRSSRS